jgi:DNA-binding NarL/FixJ family response regulator
MSTPEPIKQTYKILIVDDHPLVRSGIAAVLSRQANLDVCCEASDEEEAIANITSCKSDLAIVDLSLQKSSGFTLFRKLLALKPDLKILVLSMHDENIYAEKVLQAGAHGYVMKQEATEILIEAVNQLLAGELYISNRMRTALLKNLSGDKQLMELNNISSLSRSELVVLQYFGMGLSVREIASKLNRSPKTIDVHRANIKQKLGFSNNPELLHFAIQWINGRS